MRLLNQLRESWAIAWSAIRANKLRSGLTTLGVVIGIVTVTLMGTAIEAIGRSFTRTLGQLGADVLYIEKFPPFEEQEWWRVRNRRDLTIQHARVIERQAGLAQLVSYEAYTQTTVKKDTRAASGVTIVGTTAFNFLARNFTISEGRFMSVSEVEGGRPVCVVGADIGTKFFRRESPLGQKISIAGQGYTVVGVMAPFDKFLGLGSDNHDSYPDHPVHRAIRSAAECHDPGQGFRSRAARRYAERSCAVFCANPAGLRPDQPDDFGIVQQDAFLKFFGRVGRMLGMAGLFITGLSLFVGGIGIMNIMFVSVAERTREIGLRKAVGAKRHAILLQFLMEAAGICLIGGFIGLAIAFPVTLAMPKFLDARLSPKTVVTALLVATITGVLSGFFPAWRAAKMNPVDALRSE